MKGKTISKLKAELDRWFSLYIRHKYEKDGVIVCYTCGARKDLKTIQNGHFVPRHILITRFDEDNCRPQCVGCNMYGRGKPLDFEENLKKELGVAKVEKMKQSRHQIFKVDQSWYEEKIEHYKDQVRQMQERSRNTILE